MTDRALVKQLLTESLPRIMDAATQVLIAPREGDEDRYRADIRRLQIRLQGLDGILGRALGPNPWELEDAPPQTLADAIEEAHRDRVSFRRRLADMLPAAGAERPRA
jgi:hypothetical protein